MITKAQLAVLHLAKKHLASALPGFNEDMWRAILKQLGRVENGSAKDLDNDGFTLVMEYASGWGFRLSWRKRTFGNNRPGMATASQVELIRQLWGEWSGGSDSAALDKWLEKFYHVTALRFATKAVAGKAITGLKRMVSRKLAKAG
jgi:hypothetical protein